MRKHHYNDQRLDNRKKIFEVKVPLPLQCLRIFSSPDHGSGNFSSVLSEPPVNRFRMIRPGLEGEMFLLSVIDFCILDSVNHPFKIFFTINVFDPLSMYSYKIPIDFKR